LHLVFCVKTSIDLFFICKIKAFLIKSLILRDRGVGRVCGHLFIDDAFFIVHGLDDDFSAWLGLTGIDLLDACLVRARRLVLKRILHVFARLKFFSFLFGRSQSLVFSCETSI